METGQQQAADDPALDAQGHLEQLLDKGFGGDLFMLALALGREQDQINAMIAGEEEVDEDLAIKINGIAQERNIDLAK